MNKALNGRTVIIAFFLLNLVFRFSLISQGPYHADCLFLAVQAEKTLSSLQLHYVQPPGFPLLVLLGSLFILTLKLLGIHDIVFAVNFMTVVFSSLCIPVLYLFVKNLFDSKTAFIAALLLTLNPLFLSLSTFGNSQPLSLFFFLLSLYLLTSFLDSHRLLLLFLSGLSLGFLGAVRAQDIAVAVFPVAFIVLFPINSSASYDPLKSRLFHLIKLLGICFLTILIFYLPALTRAQYGPNASLLTLINDRLLHQLIPVTFKAVVGVAKLFFSTVSVIEWITAALGICLIVRKRFKLALLLLLWFIVPFALFLSLRFFVIRMLLFSIVPLCICSAHLLANYPKNALPRLIVLITVIAIIWIHLFRFLPTIYFRHHHNLLPDFFKWAKELTEANAYIIERDHSLFIQYYAKRQSLEPDIRLYGVGPDAYVNFKREIDTRLNEGFPVYITKHGLTGYSLAPDFKDFMIENYTLNYIGGRLIEDWHIGVLEHVIDRNDLFKIQKKSQRPTE